MFVDRAELAGLESLWALKRVDEREFEFYRPDSGKSDYSYPREILVEHAAQSMMVLGYNYGLEVGWLEEGSKHIGLLTTIEDFSFDDVRIGAGDEVVTQVEVKVAKVAMYYLRVRARITVGEKRAAEGVVSGMFLNGQYDSLFGALANYDPARKEGIAHPHFSFFDRSDPSLFDSSYWFLAGHFPGSPCIPGCTFIRGVVELAGPSMRLGRILRARFKKIAVPHNRYRYEIDREGNRVDFSIVESSSGELHARGVIELED